ncbi:MAG: hypothetical protein A07HR67_00945 [uncultured archaeon A07HR67]|nr:MAG: hypothetical protein A07HR67_00945 [uncultured archaeon A07HR67]
MPSPWADVCRTPTTRPTSSDDENNSSDDETTSSDDENNSSDDENNSSDDETTSSDEDRRYRECPREVIPYEQFPADVRAEIDAALGGRYEASRVVLRDAMDVSESYLSVDETYYDPRVTTEGSQETLTLHRVKPKALPDPRPVSVEHDRDGKRTVTIVVVADDGTVLIDERRELRGGSRVEFGDTTRVGTHECRVTIAADDGAETDLTTSVRIDESRFSVVVLIEGDDLRVSGAVAELGICRYDTDAGADSS